MLIAEEVLLLLLHDQSGTLSPTTARPAVGGALLAELCVDEHAQLAEKVAKPAVWSSPTVEAAADEAPDEPLLAEAKATVAATPRTAQQLVDTLGADLTEAVAERLVAAGVLRREDRRVLGRRRTGTRWPVVDPAPVEALRTRLTDVLVAGQEPDARTTALISLLAALGLVHKAVDAGPIGATAVRRRAQQITQSDWAGQPVTDAVEATAAAVAAALAAGTPAAAG